MAGHPHKEKVYAKKGDPANLKDGLRDRCDVGRFSFFAVRKFYLIISQNMILADFVHILNALGHHSGEFVMRL